MPTSDRPALRSPLGDGLIVLVIDADTQLDSAPSTQVSESTDTRDTVV